MRQFASIPVLESEVVPATGRRNKDHIVRYGFVGLVLAGILLRLLVAIFAGNGMRTPWGGGGDTPAYVLLAQNLVTGKGFTYAGEPTALRAPLYPIILATCLKVFGTYALAAVRWLQFLEGLAVAFLCALIAGRIYGERARKAALAIALFFPTLVEMNGEVLTEATTTFFVAVFFYLLLRYLDRSRWATLVEIGAIVGLASLTRFNMALLGFVVLGVILFQKDGLPKWRGAALAAMVPLFVISPWLIRNLVVFHGEALFSTHAGLDTVEGIITPQGRGLPGDAEKLRAALGWVPPVQIETNSPSRHELPAEPTLQRQAWHTAMRLWWQTGWRVVPLTLKKLSYFWLSTDQLLWTGSFSRLVQIARVGGVLAYWIALVLAIIGWVGLRTRNPTVAWLFLSYAVLVTIAHLPFAMNTRIRMPFIDPLVVVLAGVGWLILITERSTLKGHGG
ncbi:MAG TPA: glycosyltransferase family 39 protein [Candidatus Acidoferrales bacterium]|nr:glycosyltransferase family 39 protein [Candidatus Acidoferrales bacterium]